MLTRLPVRLPLVLLPLLVAPVVSFAQDAGVPAVPAPDPAAAAAPPQAQDPYAELDALDARRDDPAALKQAEERLRAGLAKAPNDYGLLWRAARLHVWLADGATDDNVKRDEGKRAWDLGESAIRASPGGFEGYYFSAVGIGNYSQAVGILKALTQGLEGTFNDRLDRAIRMKPDYLNGFPVMLKGRYHYELPWPKRDLAKGKALFQQVNAKHPENLRAWLYLAELLLKDGDAKGADAALKKVFAGDVQYDPPEGKRVKAKAAPVRLAIDKELK